MKLGNISSPTGSFPSILRWQFWVLCLPYKFQNQFIDTHKTTCWDFYWDHVKSIGLVGKNWHFDTIEVSYPEHAIFIHLFNSLLISFTSIFPFSSYRSYILWELGLHILFWGANVIGNVLLFFLISNSTVYCQYRKKQFIFIY